MAGPIRGYKDALLGLLGCTAWISCGMTGISQAEDLSTFKTLVSKLTISSVESPGSVETTFGIRLTLHSGGGPFSLWTAGSSRSGGLLIRNFDYRHPEPGGNATAGPLLVLSVAPERCIEADDIEAAFPSARLTDVPRHGPGVGGAKFYLSLPADGGVLSFGIAAEDPRCLNTIVFNADPA